MSLELWLMHGAFVQYYFGSVILPVYRSWHSNSSTYYRLLREYERLGLIRLSKLQRLETPKAFPAVWEDEIGGVRYRTGRSMPSGSALAGGQLQESSHGHEHLPLNIFGKAAVTQTCL